MYRVQVYYVNKVVDGVRDLLEAGVTHRRVAEFDFTAGPTLEVLNRTWELLNPQDGPTFVLNPRYVDHRYDKDVIGRVILRSSMVGDIYSVYDERNDETRYFAVAKFSFQVVRVRHNEEGELRVYSLA